MSTGNELVTLKQVDNYYKDLRKRSAPVIFNNAIGNPAVFSDGADGLPIQSLKVHLLPRQEGTGDPSPENIRSIIPWNGLTVFGGGKNLLKYTIGQTKQNNGVNYEILSDGGQSCKGTATATSYAVDSLRTVLHAGSYTVSVSGAVNMKTVIVKNKAYFRQISGSGYSTFSVTEDTEIGCYSFASNGDTVDETIYVQLEAGQTATAYEPCHPITETDIVFPALGKNLLPESTVGYGSYNTTGEKIQDGNNKYRCLSVNLPTGNYTFSTDTENCIIIRLLVDDVVVGSGGKAQSKSFTLSNPANVKIAWRNDTTTEITGTLHNQIETGSTPTEYEPFDNTVYGGVVDITNGKLTVEYGIVDLNSIAFYAVRAGFFAAYAKLPEYADRTKFACNAYKVVSYTYWDDMEDLTIMGITPGNVIRIRDDSLADVPALQAKLTELDAKLVYPLVEPYEVQLTPTQLQSLLGNNTIWSDANGDIEVEYRADTDKFISNAIANQPHATSGGYGIMTPGAGLSVSNDKIITVPAGTQSIKEGASSNLIISPAFVDAAAFYGLSRAAGVDMKNSSNPVGQFTDEAKVAIQKMLGIYEAPWELIREDTVTNETADDVIINVDGNGQSFELTDLILQIKVPLNTNTVIGSYGLVHLFYYGNSDTYIPAMLNAFSGPKQHDWFASVYVKSEKNSLMVNYAPYSESGNNRTLNVRNQFDFNYGITKIIKILLRNVQGTITYKLYGKRKWN